MSILAKHLSFVKEQVAVQGRLATRYQKDERRSALHSASSESFRALADDLALADSKLDECAATASRRPEPKQLRLSLTPQDVDGLPQELMAELSYSGGDKTEFALVQAIDKLGGIASLDQILVATYRATGEILKRTTLTSRLYRMAQRGLIFTVPSRKGVYSTTKFTDQDAALLFGADSNSAEGEDQES